MVEHSAAENFKLPTIKKEGAGCLPELVECSENSKQLTGYTNPKPHFLNQMPSSLDMQTPNPKTKPEWQWSRGSALLHW